MTEQREAPGGRASARAQGSIRAWEDEMAFALVSRRNRGPWVCQASPAGWEGWTRGPRQWSGGWLPRGTKNGLG